MKQGRLGMSVLWLAAITGMAAGARTAPFIIGADISWLPQREAEGRAFYDQGIRKDALLILKDHKFNHIRLRIFHNPAAPGGYSSRGYCDLEQTKAMALRVKAAGMKLLLDFHYSDTWADPGSQRKPAAWADLGFPELVRAVHDYTRETLLALQAQGTLPDMVQIGNEINPGLMLPSGSISNWGNLAALLDAGIRATREVSPSIKVMLHIAEGGGNAACRYFMDNAIARGLAFDILGLSCYTEWHGQPAAWEANFRDLATRYRNHSFMIVEYSHEKRRANEIMFSLPDGKGLGTFIWEPLEWLEKVFDDKGGGRWDANSLLDIYPEISRMYGGEITSGLGGGIVLRAGQSGGRLRLRRSGEGTLVYRALGDASGTGIHDGLGRNLERLLPAR